MSIIQTNVLAINSHRSLKNINSTVGKTSARLSSGYRINSAADDAAGLAISEKMRAQIKGLDQASRNAQDAISLVQTAEGGMQEITNMVQRMRELVTQASNDTNDQSTSSATEKAQGDRQKLQDEINQLTQEIDSMAGRTEFNKKKVINGDYGKGTSVERAALKIEMEKVAKAKEDIYKAWNDPTDGFEALVEAARAEYKPADATNGAADATALAKFEKEVITMREQYHKMISANSTSDINDIVTAITGKFVVANKPFTATKYTDLTTAFTATGDIGKPFADLKTAASNLTTARDAANASKDEGLYFQVGANNGQKNRSFY